MVSARRPGNCHLQAPNQGFRVPNIETDQRAGKTRERLQWSWLWRQCFQERFDRVHEPKKAHGSTNAHAHAHMQLRPGDPTILHDGPEAPTPTHCVPPARRGAPGDGLANVFYRASADHTCGSRADRGAASLALHLNGANPLYTLDQVRACSSHVTAAASGSLWFCRTVGASPWCAAPRSCRVSAVHRIGTCLRV